MRLIMAAADRANQFIDSHKPWELRRDPGRPAGCTDVCTIGLNLFRQLAVYLAPVLPQLAQQTGELLGDPIVRWEQSKQPLVGTKVNRFEHLMKRVDREASRRHDLASTDRAPSSAARQATAAACGTRAPPAPASTIAISRCWPSRWPRRSPSTISRRSICGWRGC